MPKGAIVKTELEAEKIAGIYRRLRETQSDVRHYKRRVMLAAHLAQHLESLGLEVPENLEIPQHILDEIKKGQENPQ